MLWVGAGIGCWVSTMTWTLSGSGATLGISLARPRDGYVALGSPARGILGRRNGPVPCLLAAGDLPGIVTIPRLKGTSSDTLVTHTRPHTHCFDFIFGLMFS